MTITFKPKYLIIGVLIFLLSFLGYYFRDTLHGVFINKAQKTVNNALLYLNNSKSNDTSEGLSLFSYKYRTNVLSNYSYYKIEEWKLESKSIDTKKYIIDVDGLTINSFGAKLERNPSFIVEKQDDKWVITDSYEFAAIDEIESDYGTSDMEKHNMMEEMKEREIRRMNDMKRLVRIADWSFSLGYGDGIKGKGTIVNNTDFAVSFVKFIVEYKDKSGNIVNTDETYAVGADELLPNQRRRFEWYTSNCYDCATANYDLKFDR